MDCDTTATVTDVTKKKNHNSIGFNLNEHWSKKTIPLSTFAIPTFKDENKTKRELNEIYNLIQSLSKSNV
jgi:hypothetical protein